MRQEKLPRLESLLKTEPVPQRAAQSPQEMLAMAAIITALHGGEDKRKLN